MTEDEQQAPVQAPEKVEQKPTKYAVLVAGLAGDGGATCDMKVIVPVVPPGKTSVRVAEDGQPLVAPAVFEGQNDRDAIGKAVKALGANGCPPGSSFAAIPLRSFNVRRPKPRQGFSWE